MSKLEAPRRILLEKDKSDPVTEALLDTISLKKLPMKTRIEQASKPLYLIRYE